MEYGYLVFAAGTTTNFFGNTYDQSLRIIVYARKAKEVKEREEREAHVHWGEDLQAEDKKRTFITMERENEDDKLSRYHTSALP